MRSRAIYLAALVLSVASMACSGANVDPVPQGVAGQDNQNGQQAVVASEGPELEPTPLTEKDLERRAEIHERMLNGEILHDGALELQHIGDISSVPPLLVVLKENPPNSNGTMVCTTAHALQALQKITGAHPGNRYEEWKEWWDKYQSQQKPDRN